MSCLFKRILIPSDLSPIDPETVKTIQEMVGSGVEEVHLAFVLEAFHEIPSDFPVPGVSLEPVAKEALSRLNTIALSLNLPSGVCSAGVYDGRADHTLAALAISEKFDLILLVSHGRNLLGRLMVGSVSTALLHISPVPVLVIKEPSAQEPLKKSVEAHRRRNSLSPIAFISQVRPS
jgi:nucleotide-binding universal stress UspA family protein